MDSKPILVTGASGYIGSRLIPMLLYKGYPVRAMVRSRSRLDCKTWINHPGLEVACADLMDPASLGRVLQGCSAAYYLVHSMSSSVHDFSAADRKAAVNMARMAEQKGLQRIIYLSGLGEDRPNLSKHLRSRAEVGRILQKSDVPTTIFRSAVILGSGSASFELIRFLSERLPVMLTPAWVRTSSQPIAVSNVVEYLAGCLEKPQTAGGTFDIGGPDILSYEDLFRIYAQVTGLHRRILIKVPFLTPGLLAWCAEKITPVPAALSEPLIEGMRNPVVCRDNSIREIIPQKLLTVRQAMVRSMQILCRDRIQADWTGGDRPNPAEWYACGDIYFAAGSKLQSSFRVVLQGRASDFWPLVERIGGSNGWYGTDTLWGIRGILDRLAGGYGLQQGRSNQYKLIAGELVDFWRALEVKPPHTLLMLSEMKHPGEAMLEFYLRDLPGKRVEVVLTVRFLPRGLAGVFYWNISHRVHHLVLRSMLFNMVRESGLPLLKGPVITDD
ncbi:SDR family oxidoreductase [Desulfonatronospira sp.]|uniref:SDR family oxidoreductase n=1 Tax=Desulfonatronospira sp. TaxID=1962951 RepID=UPI0025C58358|nr:SDR family oxidoreductase [Desulfonatronospira sp.]